MKAKENGKKHPLALPNQTETGGPGPGGIVPAPWEIVPRAGENETGKSLGIKLNISTSDTALTRAVQRRL